MARLNQHERMFRLAFLIAENATCDRSHHGCVVTQEGLIIATGYNGAIEWEPHCDHIGHQLVSWYYEDGSKETHCIRGLHAEQNAIINAAICGVSINESSWFITGIPCWTCAKMILRTNPKFIMLDPSRGSVDPNKDVLKFLEKRTAILTSFQKDVMNMEKN